MRTSTHSEPTSPRLRWAALLVFSLAIATAGCNRAYYRQQADDDVYQAVECAMPVSYGPRGEFTIDPDPRSRMFDPFDPDCPPMPPDDPDSHRIMHCVDCKRGYPCWHKNGDTDSMENPDWLAYLPTGEDGSLTLDLHGAVATALVHSTNYQRQYEELYLSALDVTFERFRFDVQFFGGFDTQFTADGPARSGGPSSELIVAPFDPGNRLRASKMFATGSELVIGMANSLVWEFSGPNTESVNTLIDFSLVQPLLRGAGRARVLERLTISERTLLANIRQMERFRRGFFVEVVTGRNAGQGPSRRGGFFGGAGLEGFTGVGGGGFGRVGGATGGGGGGGGVAGGAGAASAGGFLGLLQNLQEIRNQEANVVALRNSAAQLASANEAGRIDRFQADLALQALYNAQSRLLTSKAAFEASLDAFKINLGLPPDLLVRVYDPLLEQFNLLHPNLVTLRGGVEDLLDQLNLDGPRAGADRIDRAVAQSTEFQLQSRAHLEVVVRDLETLHVNVPARREALRRLGQRPEILQGDVEPTPFDVAEFDKRVEELSPEVERIGGQLETTWSALEGLVENGALQDAAFHQKLVALLTQMSDQLLELQLIQARIRLDTILLDPISLAPEEALEIARTFRRDWMNARATLVDTWRLIEFNANDLLSSLDITFSGDISNTQDDPLRLRDSTGRLRVGLQWDAPLTRLSERNIYRQALIEYQQARRSYYILEDRIYQGLRNTLRTIQLNEVNLELRRVAVLTAISQVDLARMRLQEPPQPGQVTQFGATTARDLVQALTDLLSVQNDFLSVWVNYYVQKVGLDWDLGTMELDPSGMWIDPSSEIGRIERPDEPVPLERDTTAGGPAQLPPPQAPLPPRQATLPPPQAAETPQFSQPAIGVPAELPGSSG